MRELLKVKEEQCWGWKSNSGLPAPLVCSVHKPLLRYSDAVNSGGSSAGKKAVLKSSSRPLPLTHGCPQNCPQMQQKDGASGTELILGRMTPLSPLCRQKGGFPS